MQCAFFCNFASVTHFELKSHKIHTPARILHGIGILLAAIALTLPCATAFGQENKSRKPLSNESGETKTYKPGSAWTLSWPLGTHVASTVDTLLYNYQRQFVTALTSDCYSTTGQFSGPGIDMIYFQRERPSYFFFNDALGKWVPRFSSQKFYNMYIPFTQLSYNWGVGTNSRTDHLKATFAGNVNRRIGIGAWVNYPYTMASYAEQAAKELGYGFSVYYTGSRYEMQAFYNHWNHVNKESGGIEDDLYIKDPAQLQGGINSIEAKSIPTRLKDTHNRVVGGEFYMSHAYKLGFWRDITQETDTVKREEFVASTKFVYSLDWKTGRHLFINTKPSDYWKDTYFDLSGSRDETNYWSVANTLGVEMVEGFQKWAKFGLMAYATYEIDRYNFNVDGLSEFLDGSSDSDNEPDAGTEGDETASGLTPLDRNKIPALTETRSRLWVGGRIEKTKGTTIRYAADAKFGILGEAAGEIDVSGKLQTQFRLGKDTVKIEADGYFRNLSPDYIARHYVSNHFVWNNDFGKIRSFRAQGRLYIPWSRTTLHVGFDNIQNCIYFDSASKPKQYSGSVQILSASIDQKLKFGIWNWDNTLTWQMTSDEDIMPLPALTLYSNMYLRFKAFKHLEMQVGVDCNWYTKYKGYSYQPATMAFTQQGADAVDVGNFIFSDVYLTARLYKVRFFLMCSNLSQGWFDKNYFSLAHYPLDPRQFRVGLSIDFTD